MSNLEEIGRLDIMLKAYADLAKETKGKRDALLRDLELVCKDPRYPYQQKCCGGMFKVKDAGVIQTFWYEEPYSCMGGDMWHYGEVEIECPLCKARLKPGNYPLVNKRWGLFGKQLESHDKSGMPPKIDPPKKRDWD